MISEQQILDQIPVLRRAARRLCSNRLDAEDLLQDALMRCLKFRGGCEGSVKNWCVTVLRHIRFGQLHREKHRRAPAEYEWSMRSISHSAAEDHVHAVQQLERMEERLAASPVLAETLHAWLTIGNPYHDQYEQMASHLGVRLGTVKSRLNRLRGMLDADADVDVR